MSGYFIGTSIVINDDAAHVHESFSTVGVGTTENVKITASDAANNDEFGRYVAVGSGRIVVGANGDDDNGSSSGSAYIFDLDGNQLTKITASDAAASDRFGYSVAVGSGRIVVGAFRDGDNGTDSGSAYIYDLDGTNEVKITASDAGSGDEFGRSVAVGCGRIVVGAYNWDGDFTSQGAAYIFDLNGNQLGIITASNPIRNNDEFGQSVAVGCGVIAIGAPNVDDPPNDPSPTTFSSGAVYLFTLNGEEITILYPPDPQFNSDFGEWGTVAVGCGRVVVGAPQFTPGASTYAGKAYLYDLNGNLIKQLTNPTQGNPTSDRFGWSVSIGNGKIIIGATNSDEISPGTDFVGTAYVYDLDGNLEATLNASDYDENRYFGYSVAVGNGRIVIGSLELFNPSGVANDTKGSAYIFNLPEDSNTYWERILETYKYSS
jgi:hypothetical protein